MNINGWNLFHSVRQKSISARAKNDNRKDYEIFSKGQTQFILKGAMSYILPDGIGTISHRN